MQCIHIDIVFVDEKSLEKRGLIRVHLNKYMERKIT